MFDVSFAPQLRRELGRVDPEQVALLVSSEFEGIYRNGGIGTFYKALSEQLADDGWYVILLLTYTDRVFGGRSTLSSINHIFSTSETERVLSLRAIHKQLLEQHAPDGYARESFRCLLFTQAVLKRASTRSFPRCLAPPTTSFTRSTPGFWAIGASSP
jgi:hypothetical protein